jgi:hypothetical protein
LLFWKWLFTSSKWLLHLLLFVYRKCACGLIRYPFIPLTQFVRENERF